MKITKLNKVSNELELGNSIKLTADNNGLGIHDLLNNPKPITIGDAVQLNHAASFGQMLSYGTPKVSYALYSGHETVQAAGTIAIATETFGGYTQNVLYSSDGSKWNALTLADGTSFIATIDLVDSTSSIIFKENHIYIYDTTLTKYYDNGVIVTTGSLLVGSKGWFYSNSSHVQINIPTGASIKEFNINVMQAFNGGNAMSFKIVGYLSGQSVVTLLDSTASPTPDIDLTKTNENQIVDCNNISLNPNIIDSIFIDWNSDGCTAGALDLKAFYYTGVNQI
jgi:hypothetical protein